MSSNSTVTQGQHKLLLKYLWGVNIQVERVLTR